MFDFHIMPPRRFDARETSYVHLDGGKWSKKKWDNFGSNSMASAPYSKIVCTLLRSARILRHPTMLLLNLTEFYTKTGTKTETVGNNHPTDIPLSKWIGVQPITPIGKDDVSSRWHQCDSGHTTLSPYRFIGNCHWETRKNIDRYDGRCATPRSGRFTILDFKMWFKRGTMTVGSPMHFLSKETWNTGYTEAKSEGNLSSGAAVESHRRKDFPALRYARQLAQETSGEVVYGLGRQPAVLQTFSQRLCRGFNDAINGFSDDGWSMLSSDGAEDVINSRKNLATTSVPLSPS
ncbi:hypothetical protein FXO37_27281 [Capsicum annuum]|nr:hypothetical protein FXO37_27281 [Capsicum annuum]